MTAPTFCSICRAAQITVIFGDSPPVNFSLHLDDVEGEEAKGRVEGMFLCEKCHVEAAIRCEVVGEPRGFLWSCRQSRRGFMGAEFHKIYSTRSNEEVYVHTGICDFVTSIRPLVDYQKSFMIVGYCSMDAPVNRPPMRLRDLASVCRADRRAGGDLVVTAHIGRTTEAVAQYLKSNTHFRATPAFLEFLATERSAELERSRLREHQILAEAERIGLPGIA
jgi:hypothetical protein